MKTLPLPFAHECLSYDASAGTLVWRTRPREHFASDRAWRLFNSRFAGMPAGSLSSSTGYVMVNFSGGNLIGAHRLAFALASGRWVEFVDHIDGNRSNNALGNLRECSRSDNQCNRGRQVNNRSGWKGVHRISDCRWRARINKDGVRHHLGVFETPEAAHRAYQVAAQRFHGEFANFG
ncbi:HNH endonuclease [Burkholderia glumae]|uniref:HNH endonuclease n=1 Tax=Burkholderia glumae TaxID=337 RepID=UPI003B8A7758